MYWYLSYSTIRGEQVAVATVEAETVEMALIKAALITPSAVLLVDVHAIGQKDDELELNRIYTREQVIEIRRNKNGLTTGHTEQSERPELEVGVQ